MKKIVFIVIGILIISAVVLSTKINTNKTPVTDNPKLQTDSSSVQPVKSLVIPMERNANNDFVVVDCGRAYYPEAFVKMSLPSEWDIVKTDKGAYDEWGSYEFAGKNNQKIKVRCGGALDPTCSDEIQNLKVTFQDKDANFACSLPETKTVRASVENGDKTAINITFENFTTEEAQSMAGKMYIH